MYTSVLKTQKVFGAKKYMKNICIFVLFIIFTAVFQYEVQAQTELEIVKKVSNEIQIDSLNSFLKDLTGVNPVIIDGKLDTITGRYAYSEGGVLASKYIEENLRNFGYKISSQAFTEYGYNVIAEKSGILYPEKKYIICAHYDTMPYIELSPGADDNGSGTSAVLEAARVLKDYNSNYSIIFALWDEEETGLEGSKYFAKKAFESGEDILGIINLDMIGYNVNDNLTVILTVEDSKELAYTVIDINEKMDVGLTLQLDINERPDGSDEMSFQEYGYKAILLEELMPRSYPHYHQITDTFDKIDHEYHFKNTRLAISTLTYLVELSEATFVNEDNFVADYFLKQNYPNPFNPTTTISYLVRERSNVNIEVYNIMGQKIKDLVNQEMKSGTYEVEFDATNLPSGVYFYNLIAKDYKQTNKMLLIK
ncbi:MAG: M20/M25/M40 family metallo-hydrolase [Melioribacteraceae bacterium]|nr:M20/M25/M40 family metallo-hydrolase [Melioribacteraceae bacterium]